MQTLFVAVDEQVDDFLTNGYKAPNLPFRFLDEPPPPILGTKLLLFPPLPNPPHQACTKKK